MKDGLNRIAPDLLRCLKRFVALADDAGAEDAPDWIKAIMPSNPTWEGLTEARAVIAIAEKIGG